MPDLLPAPDQQQPPPPFVWGSGGVQMTPERIAAARKVAQAMQATGMDYSPVRSPFQGAARVAQALMGAYDERRANQAENANAAADKAMVSSWFGAGAAPVAPMSTPAPTVLGEGGQPATPDAQGVYGADATMMPDTAVAAGAPVPRGIRNNNPLNIEAGDFTKGQPGFTGSDGRFAQFQTPDQGVAAASKLLDTYQSKYGLNSVRGIVNRWAPQAEAANNTPGYVASVAGRLGVDPDQPLTPAQRPALIAAMGQFENGRPIAGAPVDPAALPPNATPTQGTVPPGVPTPVATPGVQGVYGAMQGVNPGVVAAMQSPYTSEATKKIAALILQHQMGDKVSYQTLPDGTILQMDPMGKLPPKPVYQAPTKPKFTQISEGFGGDKKFGFVDEATRKTYDATGKPIDNGPGSPQVGNIPTGADGMPMQGPELLTHLEKTDPVVAAGVKGIIAGDINAGGRNLQKLLPLAELVDPSMKQFDYASRSKTQLNYRSGAASNEIKAYNTAINHADKLAGISEKLGGSDILPGVLNPLTQSYKRNTGDQAYQSAKKDWDATSETLATEVSKALNGGVPHVADKEHWREIFQSAGSPTERRAAIRSVMGVLEGRLGAAAQNYNQGMGTNREPLSFIDPANVGKFQKLLGTDVAVEAPAAAAPAGTVRKYNPATGMIE